MRVRAACFAVLTGLMWVGSSGVAFASKVNVTPTLALTEGDSHDVTFTLDAPIIASTPNPTVTVNFTVDDPSRVSLSTSSLEWDDNAWSQVRTLTVNALHDGVHDDTQTVVVHFTVTSASEYYSNYAGSFSVVLTDTDPAPMTTTTTGALPSSTSIPPTSTTSIAALPITELPRTGGVSGGLVAFGLALAAGGALGVIGSRRAR